MWQELLYLTFAADLSLSVVQALGIVPFDLLGMTTTAITAIISWLLLMQYGAL